MKTTAIYCQSCRSANNSSESHCNNCGARLLLVVFPSSLQYDTNHTPTYYEDHLLERVSLLELRLSQMTERLESAFEFLQRGLDTLQKDRLLLRSFLEAMQQLNPEFVELLTEKSKDKHGELKNRQTASEKRKKILSEILTQHKNPNSELFTHLITEGIRLLTENEEKQAFQMLERAAMLSPTNAPLHLLIAVNLFRVDKYSEARAHLEKSFALAPTDPKTLFLLAAITADFGEVEQARKLLSVLIGDKKYAFVVNYIWGMLAAYRENWSEAIAAFKETAALKESAEIYYLIGCACYELKDNSKALFYLQKAILIDSVFPDAWFMQSVVYKAQNNEIEEKNAFRIAAGQKENGAQSSEFTEGRKIETLEGALPFARFRKKNVRILTGTSLRLTKSVRAMILQVLDL